MNKLYFITFGNENYYNSLKLISKEVKNFNIFDEIIIITDKELKSDTDFWNKHSKFIENNKRGYGYWLWKPYINLKLLEKINENDIVLYTDAGCTFNINGKNRLIDYINLVKEYDILSFQLTHPERKYTKRDLFEYFDYENNDQSPPKIKSSHRCLV